MFSWKHKKQEKKQTRQESPQEVKQEPPQQPASQPLVNLSRGKCGAAVTSSPCGNPASAVAEHVFDGCSVTRWSSDPDFHGIRGRERKGEEGRGRRGREWKEKKGEIHHCKRGLLLAASGFGPSLLPEQFLYLF
jgi:hypothetical protein